MNQMGIKARRNHRIEQIVRRIDIVVDGVILVAVGFHRIGGCTLFGKMHDGFRAVFAQPRLEQVIVAGDVDQMKMDAPSGFLMPDAGALLNGIHRGQRLDTQFRINPAAGQIVDDVDVVTLLRQMKRRGPTDKAVTTKNCDFHGNHLQMHLCGER